MWVWCKCFDSRSIYPFKRNKVPEYLFSTSPRSETATSIETTPPKVALDFVPSASVTNSQNFLPMSAATSLSTLRTLHYSDT